MVASVILSRGADFNTLEHHCIALYEVYDQYQCTLIDVKNRGSQICQNSRSHLIITGLRKVALGYFHTEDPKIVGSTIKI
jgi:hypothetical protein